MKKRDVRSHLDQWVARSCGNTALIAFVTGHFDVTGISPTSTPATTDECRSDSLLSRAASLPVLHQPVVFAGIGTVANGEDTVVKSGLRAEGFAVD